MRYTILRRAEVARPFEDLMDSICNRVLNDTTFGNPIHVFEGLKHRAYPKLNVKKNTEGNKYIVEVSIPGMQKEDVNIMLEDNILTISGKKRISSEGEYFVKEISCSEFSRSIQLDNLDIKDIEKDVKAVSKNGLLTIELPCLVEHGESKVKQIKIG